MALICASARSNPRSRSGTGVVSPRRHNSLPLTHASGNQRLKPWATAGCKGVAEVSKPWLLRSTRCGEEISRQAAVKTSATSGHGGPALRPMGMGGQIRPPLRPPESGSNSMTSGVRANGIAVGLPRDHPGRRKPRRLSPAFQRWGSPASQHPCTSLSPSASTLRVLGGGH